jgi:hypothetical protein
MHRLQKIFPGKYFKLLSHPRRIFIRDASSLQLSTRRITKQLLATLPAGRT